MDGMYDDLSPQGGGDEGGREEPTWDPREGILPLIPSLRTRARSLAPAPPGRADDLVRDAIARALLAWDRPGRAGADLEAWLLAFLPDPDARPQAAG